MLRLKWFELWEMCEPFSRDYTDCRPLVDAVEQAPGVATIRSGWLLISRPAFARPNAVCAVHLDTVTVGAVAKDATRVPHRHQLTSASLHFQFPRLSKG